MSGARQIKPVPDDFHIHARVEGDLRLRKRYSCGGLRITAWRNETGIVCEDPRARRGVASKPKEFWNYSKQSKRRGRKPSPLTWNDDDPDDYNDVFADLGIDRRGMIDW